MSLSVWSGQPPRCHRDTADAVPIWQVSAETPVNLIIAASAMAAVPTIVFVLIFQRSIVAGLRLVVSAADHANLISIDYPLFCWVSYQYTAASCSLIRDNCQ